MDCWGPVRQHILFSLMMTLSCVHLASCAQELGPPPQLPTYTAPSPPTSTVTTAPAVPDATASPTLEATPTTVSPPTLAPNAISIDNLAHLQPVLTLIENAGPVWGVAASPDGSRIAAGGNDWKVRLFDGSTGDLLHELERHQNWVYSVAFSPDGTRLVSGGRDRTMQIWDPATGERITGSRTNGEVFRIAFSPDGRHFATGGFYSAIGQVWDTATGAQHFLLEGHHTRLRSLAYSPDGRWLASGDANGLVLIRDPSNGLSLLQLGGIRGEALSMAFPPARPYLALGTSEGEIRIWNVERERLEAVWMAHSGGGVWGLVYSGDASLIISAGLDGIITLWDAETHENLLNLPGHGAGIRCLALSRDGATLVSSGENNHILVWRVLP